MEPEEGLDKLGEALGVCQDYQTSYHQQAANLDSYFTDRPVVAWDFNSSLIFARLTRFTAQMSTIQVYT